jgi:hypothetical protein
MTGKLFTRAAKAGAGPTDAKRQARALLTTIKEI